MKPWTTTLLAAVLLMMGLAPDSAQARGKTPKPFPRGLYGGGFSYPGIGWGGFSGDMRYKRPGDSNPGFNTESKVTLKRVRRLFGR